MTVLDFKSQVFLAPMAGITDRPMREIVSSFGSGVMVSEMAAVNALQRKNPKTYRIADVREENYPVVVQLVGSDIPLFVEAAKLAADLGAHSLDINMGCPVKKIVNSHAGSYLMKEPQLAAQIIEAVAKATPLKVSVKFRKGWDNNHINAVAFAKDCENAGAAYLTVHGRTRSDFYSGKADWDIIAAVKTAVKIPVIGNGDVTDVVKAKEMSDYTGVDGIMIGRAALGAPWLISQTHNYLQSGTAPQPITVKVIKETLLKHIAGLINYYGERLALPLSRKYVCWYCKTLHDAKRFREKYMKITDFASAFAEIERYFAECEQREEQK